MKKVLKITESQYKSLLLEQMGPEIRFKRDYEYPKLKQHGLVNSYSDYNKKFYNTIDIKTIYDVFDCSTIKPKEDKDKSWWDSIVQSGDDWLDYGHCIVDNISMAVSVVPVIGTIASGVFDLLNSVVYLGEARYHSLKGGYLSLTGDYEGAKKQFKEGGMSLGFAGLSALGIIPGVSEFKALGKVSKGVIKNTDNILKELTKQSIKKGSKNAEDIKKVNQVIEKYSKGMSTSEKKQLGELLDLLGNPKAFEEIKNMGKFNDFTQKFMEWTGLKNYQLRTLIGSKDFNKILKNNGNDIYKALKSNETKKLISNIIAQGVSAVAMIGFSKWLENKIETLKKAGMPQEEIKRFEEKFTSFSDTKKTTEGKKALLKVYDSKVEDNAKNKGISIEESEIQIAQEVVNAEDFFTDLLSDEPENTHTIQKGENLSTIAKKYGMKWTDLYDKNKDIITNAQKEYGGLKTCKKPYCKGRETPSPEFIYKGITLKI